MKRICFFVCVLLLLLYSDTNIQNLTLKEHKKYEFGNKVSIIRSITGKKVGRLAGDRGYRGKKEVNGTQILIPDAPHKKDSYHTRRKKHKLFCKRAGIEPTIAHMKSDFRLERNFYKGVFGDAVNALLVAAAYNFKRAMRLLWALIENICETLYSKNVSLVYHAEYHVKHRNRIQYRR